MTAKELPSPEILRKLLRYEPETGGLFWRERPVEFCKSVGECKRWNMIYANKPAFATLTHRGYMEGRLFKRIYGAHRVIWAMQTGAWPINQVDHINQKRMDNRWCNLREATRSQNCANTSSRPNSSSKYLGVGWHKSEQNWRATIRKNGCKKHIGSFDCEIQAAKAYDAAALEIHGQFANLNFPEREAS
jgi:hypothetical protein